jgi:hypothetical protein
MIMGPRMVLPTLAAAALLAGCSQAFIESAAGHLSGPPWRKRSGWSQASAVLVRVRPVVDNQSDVEKVEWGLNFYRADTGKLRFVSILGKSLRGRDDGSSGLFLVTLRASTRARLSTH